ncbi:MAG: hypothetical protein AAGA92_01400 [Planctomycetota bacterium]
MHATRPGRCFAAALILCGTLTVVCESHAESPNRKGAKKYSLRYKFQSGEVLRYKVKHAANIRSNIDGTSQEVETRSESVKAWKVTDVLPSGEIQFVHLVESVKMSNRTPGKGETSYDSTADEEPPKGYETAARAIGIPLSVLKISPSGDILDREEKHPQPPTSDDLPITLELPGKPIAVGEKWTTTYEIEAERKGGTKTEVRTRRLCRLKSVSRGVAAIEVKYDVLTPISPYIEAQLVQRLTKGLVRFDIEAGRFISQRQDVDKNILGFAGATSSMRYESRFREDLIAPQKKVARKR